MNTWIITQGFKKLNRHIVLKLCTHSKHTFAERLYWAKWLCGYWHVTRDFLPVRTRLCTGGAPRHGGSRRGLYKSKMHTDTKEHRVSPVHSNTLPIYFKSMHTSLTLCVRISGEMCRWVRKKTNINFLCKVLGYHEPPESDPSLWYCIGRISTIFSKDFPLSWFWWWWWWRMLSNTSLQNPPQVFTLVEIWWLWKPLYMIYIILIPIKPFSETSRTVEKTCKKKSHHAVPIMCHMGVEYFIDLCHYLWQERYVFSVVYFSVWLQARIRKTHQTDFPETWWQAVAWAKEKPIKFWSGSKSWGSLENVV